jgi:hypothetical protein
MLTFVRAAGLLAALLACASAADAATPKEIDAAVKKGTDSLKARHTQGGGFVGGGGDSHGIGATCLGGLALLEAGVPVNDPAVKRITESVRQAAYSQTRTYPVSLCLMYLDRHGDPADVPLVQALAVRLLASQSPQGGWGYETVAAVGQADEQRLRAMKPGQAGKFHPEVEKYYEALRGARAAGGNAPALGTDDNSNTQFGVLALWLSRKHGVPVDGALDLIERRYVASQTRTGGWAYNGPNSVVGGGVAEMPGSPSMYCAGLIGLATGVARREEKLRPKDDPPKPEPEPKAGDPKKNPDDPFFNPPPKGAAVPPKKNPPPRPLTATDRAVQAALTGLGAHLAESAKAGRGALVLRNEGAHGHHDLYFLWSVERVGVVFGLDKIGGVDWYEAGAHSLVHTQSQDGSWGGNAMYGGEVSTAFAVLFLCKSNLARDLSGKVQKETGTEMKAGTVPGIEPRPNDSTVGTTNPNPATPPPFIPGATGNQAATLAAELLRATDKDWGAVLGKLRDAKGTVYTQALTGAVYRLDGDRRKAAREALAVRLTRMTDVTLRAMAKDEDSELRRAAVLAMAMKDEKAHIPDLVNSLLDEDDLVVRAARAGLKSLSGGEDFGPAANATAGEKILAVESWKKWMNAQK